MTRLSAEAEKQLNALLAYYLARQRPEAVSNLVAAVRRASSDIEQGKAADLSAPRPYPGLAHPGERWTKSGRYWFAYTSSAPSVILAIFHDQADIPGRL